jgi:hypothetical protein
MFEKIVTSLNFSTAYFFRLCIQFNLKKCVFLLV